MKTRRGFVSNSSSSSFIVFRSDKLSTRQIAQAMVNVRDFDHDHMTMRALKNLKGKIDDDTPITFSTINYESFIFPGVYKDEPVFYIETSNNHTFYDVDELTPIREEDVPEGAVKEVDEFYDIEREIWYKSTDYSSDDDKFCDEHCTFFVELTRGEDKGKKVCPICQSNKEQKIN